jgi:2-iminobutanoate/2-iminopropanoate deaminase
MNKLLPLLLLALFATTLPAQNLRKEKLNIGPWENEIGYAQAVRVGNTLYISGSVGTGAMPDAINAAFGAIKQTLAHYGLDFRHVVKENAYTTDIEALKAAQDVRKPYYGTDFPAATWVQVARLYMPEAVIEVEVVAVFPDTAATASAAPKP